MSERESQLMEEVYRKVLNFFFLITSSGLDVVVYVTAVLTLTLVSPRINLDPPGVCGPNTAVLQRHQVRVALRNRVRGLGPCLGPAGELATVPRGCPALKGLGP